jgi:hypothetical protein
MACTNFRFIFTFCGAPCFCYGFYRVPGHGPYVLKSFLVVLFKYLLSFFDF